jgi:hypothetical protein
LTPKRLEIASHLGRWEVVHNGVALCDFDTAEEAARAAEAVARYQPRGEPVVISLDPAGQAALATARHGLADR